MKNKLVFFAAILVSLSFMAQAEPDLKEANVMDVERDGDRFSVTLYHDDEGEQGYADWWQIETLEGEKIVRRDLLHSHGTRNFTRSDTAQTPDNISEVVVRGHDETHGYGGQTIILNLETGEKQTIRQGPEPDNFSQNNHHENPEHSEENNSNTTSLNRSEDSNNSSINESQDLEGHGSNHSHDHEHSEESSHDSSTGFSIESVFNSVKQLVKSLF